MPKSVHVYVDGTEARGTAGGGLLGSCLETRLEIHELENIDTED